MWLHRMSGVLEFRVLRHTNRHLVLDTERELQAYHGGTSRAKTTPLIYIYIYMFFGCLGSIGLCQVQLWTSYFVGIVGLGKT